MNNDLLPYFQRIYRKKAVVRLLNIYKGLSITGEGTIHQVDDNVIFVNCSRQQLACIYMVHETFIQSDEFKGTVRASLLNLEPSQQQIVLTNFHYIKGEIGRRAKVRVEPDAPIQVQLHTEHQRSSVLATLVDISVDGLGIYLGRFFFSPRVYMVGTRLGLEFYLPNSQVAVGKTGPLSTTNDLTTRFSREELRGTRPLGFLPERESQYQPLSQPSRGATRIACQGEIKHIFADFANNRYRIGISLPRVESIQSAIAQYISQRQADIIREFKDLFNTLAR